MRIAQIPGSGSVVLTFLICIATGTAAAQWFSIPLPGTPRTPDGKPNLTAPTPRTAGDKPDLTGIWQPDSFSWNEDLVPPGTTAPMLPAAAEVYKHRVETLGWNRPETYCMPHGVPDAITVPVLPFKILQTPNVTLLLMEEFHMYRQIHSDGRKLPVNPDPAWYGYSIGHWEGDTFVAETAGFREGSWLDNSGHPHSDALRTTERFHRVNFGHLEVDVTIDDPKNYTRPWKADTMKFTLQPDTELLEHLCESKRDLPVLERVYGGKK